jgi:hypothetical protein
MNSAKQTDSLVAVSVPMGKATLSAMWGSRNSTDFVANANALNGNKAAAAFQVAYSLSKRTTLVGNFAQWQQEVGAQNTNQWLAAVSHSF